MERIEMGKRELKRLEVLMQVVSGGLSQVQAGVQLSLTSRQIRRLLRRYEAEGAAGLVSARPVAASHPVVANPMRSSARYCSA